MNVNSKEPTVNSISVSVKHRLISFKYFNRPMASRIFVCMILVLLNPAVMAQPCAGDPGNFISYFGTADDDRVSVIERIDDDGYVVIWYRDITPTLKYG